MTFPSLNDATDRAQRLFDVVGLPETLVVDPDGAMRVPSVHGGLTDASARTISDHLDAVAGP